MRIFLALLILSAPAMADEGMWDLFKANKERNKAYQEDRRQELNRDSERAQDRLDREYDRIQHREDHRDHHDVIKYDTNYGTVDQDGYIIIE